MDLCILNFCLVVKKQMRIDEKLHEQMKKTKMKATRVIVPITPRIEIKRLKDLGEDGIFNFSSQIYDSLETIFPSCFPLLVDLGVKVKVLLGDESVG